MDDRRQLTGIAALLGATIAGAAFVQRRHTRAIAADPERELLESPPSGEPHAVRSADGREMLIPFVRTIVPEVDVAAGRLVVDPPDGLLEL